MPYFLTTACSQKPANNSPCPRCEQSCSPTSSGASSISSSTTPSPLRGAPNPSPCAPATSLCWSARTATPSTLPLHFARLASLQCALELAPYSAPQPSCSGACCSPRWQIRLMHQQFAVPHWAGSWPPTQPNSAAPTPTPRSPQCKSASRKWLSAYTASGWPRCTTKRRPGPNCCPQFCVSSKASGTSPTSTTSPNSWPTHYPPGPKPARCYACSTNWLRQPTNAASPPCAASTPMHWRCRSPQSIRPKALSTPLCCCRSGSRSQTS